MHWSLADHNNANKRNDINKNSMAIFLTILVAGLIVAGLYAMLRYNKLHVRDRRASAGQRQAGSLSQLKNNKFFYGAELSMPGCEESKQLLGKPFPFEEAPKLPVPGCNHTVATCACVFRGLRDRRTAPRRVNPDRRSELRFDKTHPDRRTNAGRRRGDRWVHHAL